MTFTTEQREIRALAREFAEGEIRPRTAVWDGARALDDAIFGSLAELGFMGMLVPEAYGGLELDLGTYLLVLEELAWGDAAVGLSVAIHNGPVTRLLLAHGNEEQRREHLPRLAAGEALGAFALSEPEAGSDAGAIRTQAVRDEDGWRLSGTKRWVTNGARADLVVVFARTGGDGAEPAIGAFLVEPAAEGYRVGRSEKTMGLRASQTVEVHLEDVRVGEDALLGEAGRGLAYAMEALDVGRTGIAAQCLGIAQAAYEHARSYSQEREQFGRPIADFQAIRFKLADMAIRIEGARALTHRAGARLQAEWAGDGEATASDVLGATALAAMAKVTASETAMWVADEAVQIYGGYGYMRDYPVEKLMRDAKGTEIYEGTSEIMRLVVARAVLSGA